MSKNGKFLSVVASPVGPLGICVSQGELIGIEFLDRHTTIFGTDDPCAVEVARQLKDYFAGASSDFSLALNLQGTDFQRQVWQVLSRIRPGMTRTYGAIATELNTSPRAVGNACRRNPIPIIVPCHRVVSAHGIGGFAGATSGSRLDSKRWLLAHEGVSL